MAIDPSRVRLGARPKSGVIRRLPRPKAGEKFLKGPIPLNWLSTAARLPGKSLHVAIAIWLEASLAKSATVRLSNMASLPFGLDRNAKYRALQWLEEAGLIAVERKLGRSPLVTVLELGEDDAAQA
jgi:DNA-binding transcriptional ArsR family regulator